MVGIAGLAFFSTRRIDIGVYPDIWQQTMQHPLCHWMRIEREVRLAAGIIERHERTRRTLAECATLAADDGGMRQLTAVPRTRFTLPNSTNSMGVNSFARCNADRHDTKEV